MIYAIRAIGSGFIKFGLAKSVGRRLAQLETSCPFELEIAAVADWPDDAERAIHRLLKEYKERGEWFRETQKTREVIEWMSDRTAGLTRLQYETRKSGHEISFNHQRHRRPQERPQPTTRASAPKTKAAPSALSLAHARDRVDPIHQPFDMGAWLQARLLDKARKRGVQVQQMEQNRSERIVSKSNE